MAAATAPDAAGAPLDDGTPPSLDALCAAETYRGALEQMTLASVGACAGDALSVAHPGDALSVAHPMQSVDSSALRFRVLREACPLPPPPLLEASLIGLPPWLH